jgi:hypothetical protein
MLREPIFPCTPVRYDLSSEMRSLEHGIMSTLPPPVALAGGMPIQKKASLLSRNRC